MQKNYFIVTPDTPAIAVIRQMDETGIGCVLVCQEQTIVGIFTQRDVVRAVTDLTDFKHTAIAELMTHPVITVSHRTAANPLVLVQKFYQHRVRHLPIVDSLGQILAVAKPDLEYTTVAEKLAQELTRPQSFLRLKKTRKQRVGSLRQRSQSYQEVIEARLNNILDTPTAAITGHRIYPNGIWEYSHLSAGCEVLFGFSAEEFTQDPALWRSRVIPNDLPHTFAPQFCPVKSVHLLPIALEYRFRHQDGTIRWIAGNATVRWVDGEGCWIVTMVEIDITERKQVELALRESESVLRQLVNNVGDIFFLKEIRTGKVLFFSSNADEIYQQPAKRLFDSQEAWLESIHPDDRDLVQQKAEQERRGDAFFDDEYRFVLPDGSVRWFWDRSFPIYNEAGQVYRFAGVNRDITRRKATEAALQQQELMFRSLFEQAAIGMNYVTLEGRFVRVNQRFCEIAGYSEAELLNTTFLDITHPEDIAPDLALSQQLITGKIPWFTLEKRMLHRSGTIVWVRLTVSLLRDPSNAPSLMVAVMEDISDRKHAQLKQTQTEAALRSSEESLKAAQQVAHLGSWEYNMATHAFTWSDELYRIFGLPLGQAPPAPETLIRFIHPSEVERFQAYVAQITAGNLNSSTDHRILRPDGSVRHIETRTESVLDHQGQLLKISGTALDITDRKQAELALQESEERFRQIAETIDQCFFIRSVASGQYLYISPTYEKIWGRPRETLYESSESCFDSIYPEDWDHFLLFLKDQQENESACYEYRIVRRDGAIRWVRAKVFIVDKANKDIARWVGVIEDITERKQAEAELKASLQEKEVLLQEIHHRVKNNLQLISSLLHLQANRVSDRQVQNSLQTSWNRIEVMALLHESLYRSVDLTNINIAEYIQTLAANLLSIYDAQHRIKLNLQIDPTSSPSLDQAVPFGLILNELLTNAMKHGIPPGDSGELLVSVQNFNGQIMLAVGNSGDRLPKDFNLFTAQSMGLRLVANLVNQLRGAIEIVRGNPTVFRIVFHTETEK